MHNSEISQLGERIQLSFGRSKSGANALPYTRVCCLAGSAAARAQRAGSGSCVRRWARACTRLRACACACRGNPTLKWTAYAALRSIEGREPRRTKPTQVAAAPRARERKWVRYERVWQGISNDARQSDEPK
eukprot:6162545-Pleurochrysis_carterae.AAC.2